jgi:hypothetical protein
MEGDHLICNGRQSITERTADVTVTTIIETDLDAVVGLFTFVSLNTEPELGRALIAGNGAEVLPMNAGGYPKRSDDHQPHPA